MKSVSLQCLSLSALLVCPSAALPADRSNGPVDLRVKVVTAWKESTRSIWKVLLRTASGEPLRESIAGTGDTVSFNKLRPGNYVVCVFGDRERRDCESVDLTPPAGKERHRFDIDIDAPRAALNQADLYRVHRSRLSVPPRARDEMIRSEDARMRGTEAEAMAHLERALELYPDYVDALNNLGALHHRHRKYDLAIEKFLRVTSLDPDFYGGWVNLAGSLMGAGRFDEALAAGFRALKLRPQEPAVVSHVALNYFYMHRYEDAKSYFRKLLELDPGYVSSPQLFLAHIALSEKNTAEAEQYLRGYLVVHPNSGVSEDYKRLLQRLTLGSSFETVSLPAGP